MADRPRTRPAWWLVYALVTGGSAWAAAEGVGRGLPAFVALGGVQLAGAIVVTALELRFPYRRAWLRSHGDLTTDLAHAVFTNNFVTGANWLIGVGLAWSGLALGGGLGLWPGGWPVAAQVALAALVQSFFGYWMHRLQHELPILWRLHAVHHSAPRLYWLNQARIHPLESLLDGATVLPVALLGASEHVLLLFAAWSGMHLILQHSNVDLRMGPLNWLLSLPELHRWHHSREPDEANGNYGGVLLVWDAVFGTRVAPAGREPPVDVGLRAPAGFPGDYLGQLAAPFRRGLWRTATPRTAAATPSEGSRAPSPGAPRG